MIVNITSQQNLTFDQFLELDFPEEGRYELVNGEIVRIQATRQHDNIGDFIEETFRVEVRRLMLNYRVSNRIVVRTQTQTGREQSRHPDVSVVDKTLWDSNLAAYTAFREPLQLVVEVVSTNWEDDYVDKLDEYQRLGIREYWIVDYLALGSRTYLGNPKEPAVFVFLLNESGQYESKRFRGSDRIISNTFPQLNLTIEQILSA
jgi:Uma2 family endonuclease